ncbi:MAG TPA: hypothetical protein PKI32_00770 [Opitutales bacterium]|nr:hypothetical protein [Opitutales bacterium]
MTDFSIGSPAQTCALCGKALEPGTQAASFLLDDVASAVRVDMHAAEAASWQPPRLVICRWNRMVREKGETPAAAARSAAAEMEAMLLALASNGDSGGNSGAVLMHLLALALERRRILKSRKDAPGTYLHVASGEIIHAPEPRGMTRADLFAAAMKLSAPSKGA